MTDPRLFQPALGTGDPRSVAYIRSATDDDAQLRDQRARVLRRARASGGRVLPESIFRERRGSGTGDPTVRPRLLALLNYCEAHPQPSSKPGTVYVTDYCRLSRSPDSAHLCAILDRLSAVGWRVETCPIAHSDSLPPD